MGAIVRISSNAPWEPIAGYSRAVKAGDWVSVSGTTATGAQGGLVGVGQMYVQAKQAIANLAAALGRLGLDLRHVVRTRIFVTDISRFEAVARAHREAFGEARPASTMVEVRKLVHPDMLVEIEADAYAGDVGVAPATHAPAAVQAAPPMAARPEPLQRPAAPKAPVLPPAVKAAASPPPAKVAPKPALSKAVTKPAPSKAVAKPAPSKPAASPLPKAKAAVRKPPKHR